MTMLIKTSDIVVVDRLDSIIMFLIVCCYFGAEIIVDDIVKSAMPVVCIFVKYELVCYKFLQ